MNRDGLKTTLSMTSDYVVGCTAAGGAFVLGFGKVVTILTAFFVFGVWIVSKHTLRRWKPNNHR
jgi:hypothetical protein